MVKLKTEAEKDCASKIICWLRKKPRSYQVAALNFLAESVKLMNQQDANK